MTKSHFWTTFSLPPALMRLKMFVHVTLMNGENRRSRMEAPQQRSSQIVITWLREQANGRWIMSKEAKAMSKSNLPYPCTSLIAFKAREWARVIFDHGITAGLSSSSSVIRQFVEILHKGLAPMLVSVKDPLLRAFPPLTWATYSRVSPWLDFDGVLKLN